MIFSLDYKDKFINIYNISKYYIACRFMLFSVAYSYFKEYGQIF